MDTKNARRAAPPGESLFSSLFSVAARGGKSPRESIVIVSLWRLAGVVKPRRRSDCASGTQMRRALDSGDRSIRGLGGALDRV